MSYQEYLEEFKMYDEETKERHLKKLRFWLLKVLREKSEKQPESQNELQEKTTPAMMLPLD